MTSVSALTTTTIITTSTTDKSNANPLAGGNGTLSLSPSSFTRAPLIVRFIGQRLDEQSSSIPPEGA